MIYEKKYIQFNDFVFGLYDIVSGDDEPIQYKGSSLEYSHTHGSYRPMKNSYLYVSERQVNLTVTIDTKKLPCDQRTYYVRFFEQELGKPGRLWAIKNNELIWAYAVANNVRPVKNGRPWQTTYDVEFVIPGGVWYKAHKQKTFAVPYDPCSLIESKGFEEYDPCVTTRSGGEDGDCCQACIENKLAKDIRERCEDCVTESVFADMSLCYHSKELQEYYGCDVPYQFIYDCEKAEEFSTERALGQRFCADDICKSSVISGKFYSDTDIPTEEMTITLVGDMKNPWITINDNTNVIEGEYSGKLIIEATGDVYYQASECCKPELLDPKVWSIPKGMDYGWTIYPQMNSIVIHLNNCCSQSGLACVYIDHSGITA